jgi:hypothetical protein
MPMIDAEFVRIAVAVAAGIVLAVIALGVAGILFVVIFASDTYGPGEAIVFPAVLLAIAYGSYLLFRAANQRAS